VTATKRIYSNFEQFVREVKKVFGVTNPVTQTFSDKGSLEGPVEDSQSDSGLEEGDRYETEIILDHRPYKKGFKYLTKWEGHGNEHNTWMTEFQLRRSKELIEEYWERKGGRPVQKLRTGENERPTPQSDPRPNVHGNDSSQAENPAPAQQPSTHEDQEMDPIPPRKRGRSSKKQKELEALVPRRSTRQRK
ncbi:hypothetical protein QBC35DRAFT_473208, partial [Podospora australis]